MARITTYHVTGMTCQHCVRAGHRELAKRAACPWRRLTWFRVGSPWSTVVSDVSLDGRW